MEAKAGAVLALLLVALAVAATGAVAAAKAGATQAGAVADEKGAGGGYGFSIYTSLRPLEGNEDGSYYPGDSFRLGYWVDVPAGWTYVDPYGNAWEEHYSLDRVEAHGACLASNLTAYRASGSFACNISTKCAPGNHTVTAEAYFSITRVWWENVTYPAYDPVTGELTGYYWRWEQRTSWESASVAAEWEVRVAAYDPHFTVLFYPATKGEANHTFSSNLTMLVRYDGNGPGRELKQRAVLDSWSASANATGLLVATSGEDVLEWQALGFFGVKRATPLDLVSPSDAAGANLSASDPFLSQIMAAAFNGTEYGVYIGYRLCPEYGPTANFTHAVLNSTSRYARVELAPGEWDIPEEYGVTALNVSAALWWSRFPGAQVAAALPLPAMALRVPLNVSLAAFCWIGCDNCTAGAWGGTGTGADEGASTTTGAVAGAGGSVALEFPAIARELNVTVSAMPGDSLYHRFLIALYGDEGLADAEDPASYDYDAWIPDAWMREQYLADQEMPSPEEGTLAVARVEAANCTHAVVTVPRTTTGYYNVTISAANVTLAGGVGGESEGEGEGEGGGGGAPAAGQPSGCEPKGLRQAISATVAVAINFEAGGCNLTVPVNSDATAAAFSDHPSWISFSIKTAVSKIASVVVFAVPPHTEAGAIQKYLSASGAWGVWKAYEFNHTLRLGYLDADAGKSGEELNLWSYKPSSLTENATVFALVTDIWGNSYLVELGTATRHVAEIAGIPLDGVLTLFGILAAVAVGWEALARIFRRI